MRVVPWDKWFIIMMSGLSAELAAVTLGVAYLPAILIGFAVYFGLYALLMEKP